MTIPPEILDSMIETLDWLVKDAVWRFEQEGIEGNYSPELTKAISLLDELKKLKGQ
jgi:hypothetical protein